MLRFFFLFVLLLAVLFGLELTPWAQEWLVQPWTSTLASISTWIVTLFDLDVVATGKVMRSGATGFAVSLHEAPSAAQSASASELRFMVPSGCRCEARRDFG